MGRSQKLLHTLLPEELQDEVHRRFGRFVKTRINPGAVERDRSGTPISRELMREAGALGLLGFNVPAHVGGGGRSWREWALVLHEIGYLTDDTAFPMLLAYCGTVTKMLYQTGRTDLLMRYVRPMTKGHLLGGFGWTEGQDPFNFKTVARKTQAGYVLSGQKTPIANAQIGDVFMIFARNAESGDTMCLLVEREDPGVEITPCNAMGLRGAGLGRVRFDEVEIPEWRVLCEHDALSYGQQFLNERRLEMPCWALGRMRKIFETAVHELAHRIRYGLPLTEMQTIQSAIGKMSIALETSRMVVESMLERVDGEVFDSLWDPPLAINKCFVIEQALGMCRTVQDIMGGAGVLESAPYERTIRDLQCLNPIAGTLQTLQVDLGVLATGEIERMIKLASKAEQARLTQPIDLAALATLGLDAKVEAIRKPVRATQPIWLKLAK
jgi:alkylation response protein AidB-like acyl-CoA dehydrogenase